MLGFGKDDKDAIADTKTALEAAKGPRAHDGVLGNAGTRVVERLLDAGIDGRGPFDSAAKIAGDALRMHDRGDAAVDAIIKEHTILAAGGGFVTSMGGFITMPVSLPANVLEFYLVATRMVAAIAKVPVATTSTSPKFAPPILLTLVGADADDLLEEGRRRRPGRSAVESRGPAAAGSGAHGRQQGCRDSGCCQPRARACCHASGKGSPDCRRGRRSRSRHLPPAPDRRPRPPGVPRVALTRLRGTS
jgi:hypothetical protein